MKMKKVTKTQLAILFFSIAYTLISAFLYLGRKNYEFLIYIGVLIFFIALISFLHLKYRFTTGTLLGISIWGLMHMLGGLVYINGTRLYGVMLLPFLRYDQFVHFYCYIFVTLIAYQILRSYSKKDNLIVSILLIFIGMGIGSLNEIIEFIAVLILPETGVGGYYNTMWDIVANTLGAVFAVVYINIKNYWTSQ
ncbi:DUF2238 domain-containing protein [Candidatus Pacearchaeota archaeon]|nr:DUF2238 domain-containing protein [Candidatus Pacearchaeota archaeon]MBD3282714.1 DUF2238 domain-containing protein [Candidatus Pacearchaeota archaeon]